MMHGPEKPDAAIVAKKPANKVAPAAAERAEPRAWAKGNAGQSRTQRVASGPQGSNVRRGIIVLRRAVLPGPRSDSECT